MVGPMQANASGSHPVVEVVLGQHVTRDRVQLYTDRVLSPTARHAATLRARAEAVAMQQGIVRFGRQPARRAQSQRRAIVASAVATCTLLLGGASALATGGATHTVVDGDTLSQLAERYATSVSELTRINQIADPNLIIVGDELQTESAPIDATPAIDASTLSYTVVEGDTIEDIAAQFDTTVADVVALNDLSNPDLLQIGQVLLVPNPSALATSNSGDAGVAVDAGAGNATAEPVGVETTPTDVDTTTYVGADASTMSDSGVAADDTGSDGAVGAGVAQMASVGVAAPAARVTPAPASAAVDGTSLYLVMDGETLDSIAALYGISPDQLLAANAHAAGGVSAGTILKIPAAGPSGMQLSGMPVVVQADARSGEAAAVEIATGYWAAPIAQDQVLAELPVSDDPHQGYRTVDGYGVYAEPLATMLERYGFHSGVFYGDAETLRAQLDAGAPVIAWTTQGMQVSELAPYTDGVNDFNLAPDKQAIVVYGYDASGVFVVDPSDGQYKHVAWEDFQSAWDAFGDMALAVTPL